ncbi:uncharacterized protein ACN2A1_011107 [Glossina fuscipes fuscipes]
MDDINVTTILRPSTCSSSLRERTLCLQQGVIVVVETCQKSRWKINVNNSWYFKGANHRFKDERLSPFQSSQFLLGHHRTHHPPYVKRISPEYFAHHNNNNTDKLKPFWSSINYAVNKISLSLY